MAMILQSDVFLAGRVSLSLNICILGTLDHLSFFFKIFVFERGLLVPTQNLPKN